MTIASETARDDYTGDDSTLTYAYNFRITDEDHLLITVRDTDGLETTLTKTTHYTVSGVGSSTGSIALVAGAFDWISGSGFFETGYHLTIRPDVPLLQETDLRNQGKFRLDVQEDQFDLIVRMLQQENDKIERSLKLPETIDPSTFDASLPATIASDAGKFIAVNDDGDGFSLVAGLPDSTAAVTSFMETLLDDDDAFDGRVTLGVSHHGYFADSGTANALVITPSPSVGALTAGMGFTVKKSAAANTGACTLKVGAESAVNIKDRLGNNPAAGELPASSILEFRFDGTNAVLVGVSPFLAEHTTAGLHVLRKGSDVASASPLVLGTDGAYFDVTGTTNFAAITVAAGRLFVLQFDGILTITHGAGITLPGKANITTIAGDRMICFSTAANTVDVLAYQRADGFRASRRETLTLSGAAPLAFSTAIPADVDEVAIAFAAASLSGTDNLLVQLGTTSGYLTSGYTANTVVLQNAAAIVGVNSTAGFIVRIANASKVVDGILHLRRGDDNEWIASGSFSTASQEIVVSAGRINLTGSEDLLNIRLTVTGTNTFDAGSAVLHF